MRPRHCLYYPGNEISLLLFLRPGPSQVVRMPENEWDNIGYFIFLDSIPVSTRKTKNEPLRSSGEIYVSELFTLTLYSFFCVSKADSRTNSRIAVKRQFWK